MVLSFPELGLELPHHLGNAARSLRSSIPGIGTRVLHEDPEVGGQSTGQVGPLLVPRDFVGSEG